MKKIFDHTNIFWQAVSHVSDYFILSCCWLLCCLPVITIGSSTIALYDTVAHCFRMGEGDMLKRFFRTFWRELGRGILITVLWAIIGCLLFFSYQILYQMGETSDTWAMVSLVYLFALLVPVSILCWVLTTESRFVYSFGQLHKVAIIYTFGYLPKTIAIVALLIAAVIAVLYYPLVIIIVPAVLAHLQSHFIEKVFEKYMPKTAEEA